MLLLAPGPLWAAGHGFLSLSGGSLRDDAAGQWYPAAAEARAGYDLGLAGWRLEDDLVWQWRMRTPAAGTECLPGPERSSLLLFAERCSANAQARLEMDRLSVAVGRGPVDVRVGRQPVNLATGFYFSANDFFAPFREDDFFREYRPGVDGLRLDYSAGPLAQASLIGALSYRPGPGGWSRGPDWRESSLVLRWLDNAAGIERVFLAGRVHRTGIIGMSLAGDVRGRAGFSVEGHYGRQEGGQGYAAVSAALFHRFANSLAPRIEYLFNGNFSGGAFRTESRVPAALRPGRNWLAAGAGFEPFPLAGVQVLAASNLDHGSRLFVIYATLSTGDSAELAMSLHHANGGPGYGYGRGALVSLRMSF